MHLIKIGICQIESELLQLKESPQRCRPPDEAPSTAATGAGPIASSVLFVALFYVVFTIAWRLAVIVTGVPASQPRP